MIEWARPRRPKPGDRARAANRVGLVVERLGHENGDVDERERERRPNRPASFRQCLRLLRQVHRRGAEPLIVATSRDGGSTWKQKQVTRAAAASPIHFGQSGCTIRTNSHGVVYVMYQTFQAGTRAPQDTNWCAPMTAVAVGHGLASSRRCWITASSSIR